MFRTLEEPSKAPNFWRHMRERAEGSDWLALMLSGYILGWQLAGNLQGTTTRDGSLVVDDCTSDQPSGIIW